MLNSKFKTRMIFIICLFAFSVISNIISSHQDTVKISRFQEVKILNLVNSPENYEGKEISFNERITKIIFNHSSKEYNLETENGLNLRSIRIDGIEKGIEAIFRGKSLIISMGFIEIYEYHVGNNNSIIFSIPGLIIFILIFFSIFRVNWKQISFTSRRDKNA